MKTIEIEQMDPRLGETLKQQNSAEAVLITEDAHPVGVFVPLPNGIDHSRIDAAQMDILSTSILLAAQSSDAVAPVDDKRQPAFGSCRGLLEMSVEDDEHLQDFEEYMR